MIIFPSLDDQPSGRVDNRLKWMQMYSARQTEDTVTVVHTTDNERVNECFCDLSCESAANYSQLTQLIKTASSQAPDMSGECQLTAMCTPRQVTVGETRTLTLQR